MFIVDKDYIQELIEDLIRFQKESRIKSCSVERPIKHHIDGPGFYYGDELHIKFTIKD